MKEKIGHTMFFTFRMHVDEKKRTCFVESLWHLEQRCGGARAGILHWNIEEKGSGDPARQPDLLLFAIFDSKALLEEYRASPARAEVMKIADDNTSYLEGSFELPLPEELPGPAADKAQLAFNLPFG